MSANHRRRRAGMDSALMALGHAPPPRDWLSCTMMSAGVGASVRAGGGDEDVGRDVWVDPRKRNARTYGGAPKSVAARL